MPTPPFILELRHKIGNAQLLVPTVSVLTYDAQGRILLVRDAQTGQWSPPGGIVEPTQTPSDAAVRETWEEAGVWVELVRLVGVFGGEHCETIYANGDRIAWVATVFQARPLAGSPRPDGDEVAQARYFDPADVATLPCREHVRLFLAAAAGPQAGGYFQTPSWRPVPTPPGP